MNVQPESPISRIGSKQVRRVKRGCFKGHTGWMKALSSQKTRGDTNPAGFPNLAEPTREKRDGPGHIAEIAAPGIAKRHLDQ